MKKTVSTYALLGFAILSLSWAPACKAHPPTTEDQSSAVKASDSNKLALFGHDKKTSDSSTALKKETNPVHVTIETSKGTMHAVLYTKETPITTENFVHLASEGFYNGLTFHRVEPGFVIQTGDPTGTGSGGSKKTIPLEIAPGLSHDDAGVLGMARTNDPNSASSQFYITLGPARFLDKNYAVFGKLTDGVDVAKEIKVGDVVKKITVDAPVAAQ